MTFPSAIHAFGRTYVPKVGRPPLWMHLEDQAAQGSIRSCAPCPAVWVLKDDQHVIFGEQWQYYLAAINSGMTLENVMLLLDYRLAFANRTGLRNPDDPRADYITGQFTESKPPQLDKVRTTSRSVLTGEMVGDSLRVRVFDSRQPPPLKPGKSYPAHVEDVRPEDYIYLPETHPWMFLTANIVNQAGEVVQFPRGAVYPWTKDNTPRSFMPHISNPDFGDVLYPLTQLQKLADDEPIPSPYRSNS
jgi:hypothetical protein